MWESQNERTYLPIMPIQAIFGTVDVILNAPFDDISG